MNHIRIATSPEVFAVIRAKHGKDLHVFGSFSDPDGTFNGGRGIEGQMFTSYGFDGVDAPLLEVKATWTINRETPHKRIDETHEYWLVIAVNEQD